MEFGVNCISFVETQELCRNSFESDFLQVAVQGGLGRNIINRFISVCRSHGVGNFPSDLRSAIGSMRNVTGIRPMGSGRYYHFGLSVGLKKAVKDWAVPAGGEFQLQFNIDGLPIYRSSKLGFWPILCRAVCGSNKSNVFIVGLFWGEGKPQNVQEYLREFIKDLKDLIASGLSVNNVMVPVSVHSIVCDAPARSFVKCVISFNGEKGCERCTVQGLPAQGTRSEKEYNGLRFFDTSAPLRSDQSFRSQTDSDHHHQICSSPFCDLAIDLIKDFPLDYMHLVLLGVVKKCLCHWTGNVKLKGNKFHLHRIGGVPLKLVNQRLELCRPQVCDEFQRRPRSLTNINYFKATEYRNIVCYLFPLVFQDSFPCPEVYNHFCLLFVAIRIMLCPNSSVSLARYCRSILVNFVESCPDLYGNNFMVYNVHNLIHLPDDFVTFGCLDYASAFPFESYMQVLKRFVKRPGNELAQVVKRVHELDSISSPTQNLSSVAVLKGRHHSGPLCGIIGEHVQQFRECCLLGRLIRVCSKDDTVFCSIGFCRAVNIIKNDDNVHLAVRKFCETSEVFQYPCPSSSVGVVFCRALSDSVSVVHIREVIKCLRVDIQDKSFVVKLLHECV